MQLSKEGIATLSSEERVQYRNFLVSRVHDNKVIARVQANLLNAGYDLGQYGIHGVDGKKGTLTTKAIKSFQESIGLKPTGELDQETWLALELVTTAGIRKSEIKKIELNQISDYGGAINSFKVSEQIKLAFLHDLDKIDFIEKIAPDAMKIEKETGIPWQVIVAQTCLETGYGSSEPIDEITGKKSKNLHGIKYRGDLKDTDKYILAWTKEQISVDELSWWEKNHPEFQKTGKIVNGKIEIRVKEPFIVFSSYEESFKKYTDVLTNSYFRHALRSKNDPIQYIKDIQSELEGENHPKYATDSDYSKKIIGIMKRYGLID